MTHEKKMMEMREIFERCLAVADRKGRDYSGTTDGMGNLRDFGTMGIVVRLGDKYHRAKNVIQTGEIHVKDESLRDTLGDMINYAALAIIMLNEENVEQVNDCTACHGTGSVAIRGDYNQPRIVPCVVCQPELITRITEA